MYRCRSLTSFTPNGCDGVSDWVVILRPCHKFRPVWDHNIVLIRKVFFGKDGLFLATSERALSFLFAIMIIMYSNYFPTSQVFIILPCPSNIHLLPEWGLLLVVCFVLFFSCAFLLGFVILVCRDNFKSSNAPTARESKTPTQGTW